MHFCGKRSCRRLRERVLFMVDPIFTNGVIAVRERRLLGEKVLRFAEMTAEDVLRALRESGFGSGAESVDGEALCEAEERALDLFIREYAPSQTELKYLLSPRDFHNAKALCKAEKLNTSAEKLLAFEGLVPVSELTDAIISGRYGALGNIMGGAVKEVLESDATTGAEIGAIFDKALYRYLGASCRRSPLLRKLLAGRADRTNILTAVRASERGIAEKQYVGGGTLKFEKLAEVFDSDRQKAEKALDKTPLKDFYSMCLAAKEKGAPFTDAERALESYEAEYFLKKRYELEGKQPFLYYVFRRRAEIQNVRIILVCLKVGLGAHEIKRRLRAV